MNKKNTIEILTKLTEETKNMSQEDFDKRCEEVENEKLNIKQVLIVRKDLHMRKGKIAAQCAHASVGVLMNNKNDEFGVTDVFGVKPYPNQDMCYTLQVDYLTHWWLNNGTKKICVSVDSEAELNNICNEAGDLNIQRHMVVDSGLTEFNGVKTKTVLAIGPAEGDVIDMITGKLKLM